MDPVVRARELAANLPYQPANVFSHNAEVRELLPVLCNIIDELRIKTERWSHVMSDELVDQILKFREESSEEVWEAFKAEWERSWSAVADSIKP